MLAMDLLSPYLLHLTIFIFSSILWFIFIFIYKQKPTQPNNLPPGKKGWPILGETLEFSMAGKRGEPEKFINERSKKYMLDVFKTSLLGQDVIVFCGDTGNKFFLSSANKYLKLWFPHSLAKAMSNTGTNAVDFGEVAKKLGRMIPEFLRTNALHQYVPIMDSMARKHLETNWSPYKQVKALPSIKKLTLALACRLFFRVEEPEDLIGIEEPFTELVEGMLSIPINFPGTPYRRALKASKIIHENLFSIIKKRKLELFEGKDASSPDVLTRILLMADENGKAMFRDEEISTCLVALLFVSHDTITSAITSILKYLGENPHVYNKVLKEQMEIANSKRPEEVLNLDDIQRMKYSWCVACESMRLAPPAQGNFREAIADFTYQGFTIPKGWKAYWTVHSTHKNPKYFKDPEKFDPSRFEGDGPAPYTFIPFGAGPHMCQGKEYARLGILTFMHNVVTRFKWQNMIPDEKSVCTVATIPVNGLPIQIQPHNN
ncbi:putative cytochrome P450 [Tripterygium wilfordii]|uniref:Putative cytochrome P450 n=1 Tax=Tripterygium wilfordii TaxID=458696 RepID=A0A7J7C7F6_TRIWF|nr:beta-amyrin 6-beta-monooxygenase-like [Tripterygium wilfordii]KAF5729696.1 putative cytochrome P450 [Tripterygium wilfordii]